MKLTKKITTLILTLSLVVGTSITAFAAPNDDVISALKNAKVPTTYVIQAENYLNTNTLTQAQSTAVIAKIADAQSIVNAAGVTDLRDLSASDTSRILADIKAAGSAIGLDITITTLANGQISVIAKDQSGTIVASFTSSEVKITGMDNSILYVGALMMILAAGSVFVLNRKNLASAA